MMNVYVVHDVRQMDINIDEPLVPKPTLVEVVAIGKLNALDPRILIIF
jgi:hypothetical protein